MVTLSFSRLRFPGIPLTHAVTVSLLIKPYYGGSFSLIEAGVTMDLNGFITDSPLPFVSVDPTQKYVLRAVNESCGAIYDQTLIINPYCPPGFTLSMDESFCSVTTESPATPPTASENSIAVTNGAYTNFGAYIYEPGYTVNGTGTSNQIPPANPFWINSAINTVDGPLNRSGQWATTLLSDQTVGFSVCITVAEDTTVLVGMGVDNFGSLNIDGTNLVTQNVGALEAQYNSIIPGIGAAVTFKIWHVYPVFLPAGTHVLEIIGTNQGSAAAIGCEVYNLTPVQLAACTSYADMGAGLLFSSKDFVGMPIQIGSGGIGYSCPDGTSLRFCESPIVCVKTITTPILY